MSSKIEKIKFSSFDVAKAMQRLGLTELLEWEISFEPKPPSEFFQINMERLKAFDTTSTERAKELIIDEIFKESLADFHNLRAWKSAPLSTDELTGAADYLLAKRQRFVQTHLLCVAEAKRDDFERGLGQCLAEMEACRWQNQRDGKLIDIYGIVTNGTGWVFYKLAINNEVFETVPYSIANIEDILGILDYIFGECEKNLNLNTLN